MEKKSCWVTVTEGQSYIRPNRFSNPDNGRTQSVWNTRCSLVGLALRGGYCHNRDIRSPCTLFSDRVHVFTVRLLYVLPFPFLSICPVSPPISERVVRSVSLFDYLICFLSHFRLLYVPVPVPLLIQCLLVIRLSHLPYLLSVQRNCARRSSIIPTSRTSPHPFYLV